MNYEMNYDAALQAARESQAEVEAPPFASLEARVTWQPNAPARPSSAPRWLATAMAGLAALVFAVDAWISLGLQSPVVLVLVLPCAVLVASAIAVHRAGFGVQLACRAAWWTFLFFGAAWALTPAETLPVAGAMVTWGCGAALLSVGREGLRHAQIRRSFDPIAFRGTLLATMVLALANAHLLALVGLTRAEALGMHGASFGLLLGSAGSLAVVVGLARLRGWAVLAGLGVNVSVLALCVLTLDPPVAPFVVGGATVQLGLLGRLLHGFYRGPPAGSSRSDRSRLLPGLLVVALVALATVAALTETYAHALTN